jgi:hypothetical protein
MAKVLDQLEDNSTDAKADAARSPTLADGISRGQTRMIGTAHQPTKTPTLPRRRYRSSDATTAQPYARRIARKSQPTFFIDHDLAPSKTVRGTTIVTDWEPIAAAPSPGTSPFRLDTGVEPDPNL